jgi:hypothetical protein
MKKTAILLTAVLMTGTAAYSAEALTGNSLLDECQGSGESFCVGFALGVANALSTVCVPDGVTAGQLTKMAERYLEAHPQNLHQSATSLLSVAFSTAWPCK